MHKSDVVMELMALKEPNMNNPWRQPGVDCCSIYCSSEGAEYISFRKEEQLGHHHYY